MSSKKDDTRLAFDLIQLVQDYDDSKAGRVRELIIDLIDLTINQSNDERVIEKFLSLFSQLLLMPEIGNLFLSDQCEILHLLVIHLVPLLSVSKKTLVKDVAAQRQYFTSLVKHLFTFLSAIAEHSFAAVHEFFLEAVQLLDDLSEVCSSSQQGAVEVSVICFSRYFIVATNNQSRKWKDALDNLRPFLDKSESNLRVDLSENWIKKILVSPARNLQSNITSLLALLVERYPQFLQPFTASLWLNLMTQIQIHPTQESLNALEILLKHTIIPQFTVDTFIRNLFQLLESKLQSMDVQVQDSLGACFEAAIVLIDHQIGRPLYSLLVRLLPQILGRSSSNQLKIGSLKLFRHILQVAQREDFDTLTILIPFAGVRDFLEIILDCFNFAVKTYFSLNEETETNSPPDFSPKRAKLEEPLFLKSLFEMANQGNLTLRGTAQELDSFVKLSLTLRLCLAYTEPPVSLLFKQTQSRCIWRCNIFLRDIAPDSQIEINENLGQSLLIVTSIIEMALNHLAPSEDLEGLIDSAKKFLRLPVTNTVFNSAALPQMVEFSCRAFRLLSQHSNLQPAEARYKLFSQALKNHKRPELQKLAIESLPVLVHKQATSLDSFLEFLSTSLDEPALQKSIAVTLGRICCVLSKNTFEKTTGTSSTKASGEPPAPWETILCGECDESSAPSSSGGEAGQLFDTWRPFLRLLECVAPVAALFLQHSLGRILRHCKLDPVAKRDEVLRLTKIVAAQSEPAIQAALPKFFATIAGGHTFFGSESVLTDLVQKLLQLEHDKEEPEAAAHGLVLRGNLLRIAGQIGAVVDGPLLVFILKHLTSALVDSQVAIRLTGFEQISFIARTKQISTKALYFHPSVIQHLAIFLLSHENSRLLQEVCDTILDKTAPAQFLDACVGEMLPQIIFYESEPRQEQALRQLVKVFGKHSREEFLVDSCPVLICHALLQLSSSSSRRSEAFDKISQVIHISADELIQNYCEDIVIELVLALGDYPPKTLGEPKHAWATSSNKALSGLCWLKENKLGAQAAKQLVPDFVYQFLLSILSRINRILSSERDTKYQEKVLRSFEGLLVLLGPKHVQTVTFKVVRTLEIVTKHAGLELTACDTWLTFLRQLDASNLGPLLTQIVVLLLPLSKMSQASERVAGIFNYLESVKNLDEHWKAVPLVDPTEFPLVGGVLQKIQRPATVPEELEKLILTIQDENVDVRTSGLAALRKILRNKQAELAPLTDDVVNTHPIVAQLVRCLLLGTRDEPVRVLCAECLGALGAIDPGRLNLTLKKEIDTEKTDIDFAADLVENYLVKRFRAARSTMVQDRVALAIQQLLKTFGCNSETPSRAAVSQSKTSRVAGVQFWRALSEDVQEIIKPFLNSAYRLESHRAPPPTKLASGPVFLRSKSFREWAALLTAELIPLARSSSKAPLFQACRGPAKDDLNTALFLLPYLFLDLIQTGDSHFIRVEVEYILKNTAKESNLKMTSSGSMLEQCTQLIFFIFDWLRQVFLKDPQKKPARAKSHPIEDFLGTVPLRVLAEAAIKVRAFPRALLHFEYHLRHEIETTSKDRKRQRILAEHAGQLQQIYVQLNQPDGLRGAASLREQTSLRDQIADYTSLHKWSDAMNCYDHALTHEKDNLDDTLGLLECHQHLGQLHSMLDLSRFSAWKYREASRQHFSPTKAALPINNNNNNNNLNNNNNNNNFNNNTNNFNNNNNNNFNNFDKLAMENMSGEVNEREMAVRQLNTQAVKAAWRLGNWQELGRLLDGPVLENDFDVGLGRALICLRDGGRAQFLIALNKSRQDVIVHMAGATLDSYQSVYEWVVKLHILEELEQWEALTRKKEGEGEGLHINDILGHWEHRLRLMQPSYFFQEPLLHFRRIIYELGNAATSEIGKCWLQIAKVCTSNGQFQTASSAIVQASLKNAPNVLIQRAKLLWKQGQHHPALWSLQSELRKNPEKLGLAPEQNSNVTIHSDADTPRGQGPPTPEKLNAAKVNLLIGRWMEQSVNADAMEILDQYKKAAQVKWEKADFYCGKFYDNMHKMAETELQGMEASAARAPSSSSSASSNTNSKLAALRSNMINNALLAVHFYVQALTNGHTHIYQALPRVLTLWFNLTANATRSRAKEYEKPLNNLMKYMVKLIDRLPAYQWYTCFSQLISRICHPTKPVKDAVEQAILRIIKEYPHQAIWSIMALTQSTHTERKNRAVAVLKLAKNEQRLTELLVQGERLCSDLLKICKFAIGKDVTHLSLRDRFPDMYGFLSKPLEMILPLQAHMIITLPPPGWSQQHKSKGGNTEPWHGFPAVATKWQGMLEQVDVMSSLQRPRKITVRGSDGTEYPFLCKPKDDLRKDNRVMEFNTMINTMLKRDAQCRRRNLLIRTYAVQPLNEDCGLIEWVPNTTGFRHILSSLYKNRHPAVPNSRKIREIYTKYQNKENALRMFQEMLLPEFPPVFHQWFTTNFPEPQNWLNARNRYARSLAVMSMVGYVMGLGDRHGENILLDSSTGDAVHVDFNCLFDKGLHFEKPEKVPFRLTQNLEDALGLFGFEGDFRAVCELSMALLRENRETLMTVLETLLHDPLVEWTKDRKGNSISGEQENELATRSLNRIDERLQGKVGTGSLILSVQGQVHYQIMEATNPENLADMYIGWSAYL